jgi:hypothetical protein
MGGSSLVHPLDPMGRRRFVARGGDRIHRNCSHDRGYQPKERMADDSRSRRAVPAGAARSRACAALGGLRCSTDASIQDEHKPPARRLSQLSRPIRRKAQLPYGRQIWADWMSRLMQMNLRTMLSQYGRRGTTEMSPPGSAS